MARAPLLAAFAAPAVGAMVAVAAVSPPMHAAADASLAAHMVQHLVLILAAAPLMVLGHPVRALPAGFVRSIARRIPLARLGRRHLRLVAVAAWLIHVMALWAWHTPRLYEWAVASPLPHALEHGSLLLTACAFWAAVFSRVLGSGGAVLYLFAAAGQSTALGALLTLAETPWYPIHATSLATWRLTPLEDQQLAGLIMWIPGGMSYATVALARLGRTLRDGSRAVTSAHES
jgi:putative membrane protein